MKFLSGSIIARIAGVALLAAGFASFGQTTTTQVRTVRSEASRGGKPSGPPAILQVGSNGKVYAKAAAQSSAAAAKTQAAQSVKVNVVQAPAAAAATSAIARPRAAIRPRPHFAPAPTVVTAQNFGNATIGSAPVTMTLSYPADATSPGASSVVPGGGVAPGSASDYIFFGNSNVEFGQGGGGQPTNLTNFTVSTLNNVEYPGNGNYTRITAPGGTSAFTTGTVVENPTNYPNTTPHTTLLATFSPLHAGSFTVYILDGNTDGIYVGNSSVGLGVNGGTAVVTPTHYISGTNEFTRYNVANASPSDVFQVYATTSTNSYPSIGGLTFSMGTSSSGLSATTTANKEFQVTSTNCTGSTCSIQVTFTPGFPGLRYDALTLTDSDDNIVYQTYLYGVGMGPQFGYEIGNYTEYDGFLTSPLGVAIGPDDLVYFTQTNSNVITQYARDFNSSNQITINGLTSPSGIAVDGSNTLYVADQANNVIYSYTAANGQSTVTTSPLNGPSQLAIDGTGALYIADTGNGRVIKIDNQGNETTIASGLTSPASVAVDSNGNVFFADGGNNGEILELAAGASSPTIYTSQMNLTVVNMAIDASETIYVTTNQGIAFYRNGSQDGLFYATGADIPVGLAVERNGDVFQTNPLKDKFSMNDRSSSNFILNTPPNTTAAGNYPIYNTGNTPLTITGLSITGPEFQIANSPPQCTPPQVIAPAMSCTVNISFLPPLAQYYTDTAIATSNSLNMPGTTDPFYLAGSGTGAPSTTTVSAAPSEVQSGKPVELLITVSDSPMTFTPSGPVTLMDGSTTLGTATLSAGPLADTGIATYTTSTLSPGTHSITAVFPGDANVSPSTSNAITVTVGSTAYLPSGLPPMDPFGQPSVVTQNLGSVAVGSNQYTVLNRYAQGSQSVVSTSTEFAVTGTQCGTSGCAIGITFAPAYPGLRTGTILLRDSSGTLDDEILLSGTGTGPQFGFDPGVDGIFTGVLKQPGAVAIGSDGRGYVADLATDGVDVVYASTSSQTGFLPFANLGVIGGLAVDSSNQVYVSDTTNNLIVTYNQTTGIQSSVSTDQLLSPGGLAVDGQGDLYIADTGHNRIIKIDSQGNETTVVSNVPATLGPIALDSAGNFYYAVTANPGSITELPAGGGSAITIANNIGSIHALAVDAAGRVYYANDAGVSIIPLSNCGSFCNIEGLTLPGFVPHSAVVGLALDGAGNIYATQDGYSPVFTNNLGTILMSQRSAGQGGNSGPVGSTTPGPPFIVSNTGNTPLTISSLAFSGTIFSLDPSNGCKAGTVVGAGQICNTVYDFTPTAVQEYLGVPLTYTSNSLNASGSTNIWDGYSAGTPASGGSGTTTLGLSPTGSISLGQTLTLFATVTGVSSSAPTGMVNFLSGNTVIASGTLVQNGNSATASVVTTNSTLAIGNYSITAMYVGDSNNPSSTSAAQSIQVIQANTTTSLQASSTSVTTNQSVTLTATISGISGLGASGSVVFFDSDTQIGNVSVTSLSSGGGTAVLTVGPPLTVGNHTYSATYSGDDNYFRSNSNIASVSVTQATAVTNAQGFGNVAVGSSASITITIGGDGTTYVPTGGIPSVTLTDQPEFTTTEPGCSTFCTVTITFTPQYPGARNAGISVIGSDGTVLARTFLYGTGTAPQFAFDPVYNQSTTAPYSAQNPAGIAIGPNGTVYVGDSGANTVTAYPVNGPSATIPLGDIGTVGAIAVDGTNTVYVADTDNDVVISSTAGGVVSTVVTSSALGFPQALAVDGTGALYIDDSDNQQIIKIDNQGNQTKLASTNNPGGMAVDAAGNVFYSDTDDNGGVVYELPANGGSKITVADGLLSTINSLALDAAGRLYYMSFDDEESILNGLSPGTTAPGYYFNSRIPNTSGGFSGALAITPTGGILAGETGPDSSSGSVVLFDRMEASYTTSAQVGSSSSFKFPISNTGDTTLTISSLALSGPAFTVDPESACHSGSTVAPDRECLVTVDFAPPAAQNYQVPLTVITNSDNASGTQNTFTLNGVGGDSSSINLVLSANSITLGQSVTLTATVIDNVSTATPTGTVTFQVGGPVGTMTLTAGSTPGTATASYTYTPTQSGTYAVGATYSGDSVIAPLTATGQQLQVNQPAAPVIVTAQNFGSVAVGQSATMTLNFSQGMNSRISLASNLEFTVVGQTCNIMCSVTILFKPLVPGLRQDAILVADESGNLQAKAYLYGTGTGPQFGFLPGQSSIDTAYASPTAITFTPDGVGYVTDAATKKVYPLYTGAQPFPITGLGIPSGIAVDGARTFYIADQTNNRIVTFNQLTNVQGVLSTSPLSNPSGVATDGTGAVYIADNGNNRIIKIDNQGTETTLASGLNSPLAVALDAGGNVYFSDSSNGNEIAEIPAAGGSPVRLFGALGTTGIAVDASGSVYTVGSSFTGIHDFISENSAISFSGSTGGSLNGIGINFNGDIWTMKSTTGQLEQLHRGSTNFNTSTPAGVSKQHTVQVVNTGNAPLTISNLSFATGTTFTLGAGSPCATGTVLPAGSECDTYVVFLPPSAQNYSDVLTYTTNTLNATGSTNTDNESGTGTGSGPATSTTTFVATPASVMVGQTIGVVATVSDGTGVTPTGTVQFLNGTTVVASATLTAGSTSGTATATATIPSMVAGTYSILASYGGSSSVNPSNSAAQNLTFTQATTTTIVNASALNLYVGQNETLTATITGFASPAMTGTVSFFDGTISIGSGTVMSTPTGGVATLALGTTVPVGTHNFIATYNADANYTASTSAPVTVTVSPPAATTISFFTSAGTPTAYGYPFDLVATVTATATAAPATPGQVIFCDASLPRCNLLSNLGIAQTNSGGRATLPIYAGIIGTHTYKAVFLGTTSFQTVTSTTQQVTIAGTYPSMTTISSSGTAGNYNLTATVAGLGSRSLSPTGSVSFMDNSDSQTLGSANVGAATLGFTAVQPTGSPVSVGTNPYGVAAGDLNGDGFVDVVVENYLSNTISVLLGNGNGTFLPQVTYAVGNRPERVLIADFNGDGYMDLVVANTGSSTVSVLLNKGNGTFYPQVTYPVGSPVGLGVMDLNHDGIADIAAADYYNNTVSVLLGNGDGTFKAAVTYPTGNTPQTLAEGDFNNDGNIDLAVGNVGDGTVSVLLGNGDGTFQAQVTHFVGSGGPGGLQVGDLNSDGNADIAVANSSLGNVGVLLGKGDGTFQPQVTYPVGTDPIGLVIADFDGDGKQDLSVGNGGQNSLYQSILLGNGDGTFQPQLTFPTGNFPYGTAVGDFNGDGYPDMAISNWNDGTATILLSQISQTAAGTITGIAVSGTPAGMHTVEAVYAGDTNFKTSTSTTIPLMQGGNPGETITGVTFSGSPANPTITITGTGFNPEPTGDNEPMSFYGQTGQDFGVNGLYITDSGIFTAGQDGDAIGLINLSYTNTLISFQFGSDYPANFANALAEGDTYIVSVDGLLFSGTVHYPVLTPQTITFPPIPNHTYGDAPFTLGATASSGLAVSYTVTSGPATVSGSTVTITGVGMVTIQATQAGNSIYAAATPVSQSFTVAQDSQTITFPAIPNQLTTAGPFSLSATASSGLSVSYNVTSGPATVSGSTVTLTGAAGTVVIQATQAGNTNYAAATPVSQSFTVSVATGVATSTTLSSNAGTGVGYEKPVILTASVKNLSSVPVTVGQVIFCSATAAHCNLNSNLGIAQLNSNGVAVLSIGSGTIGPHGYTAEFLGTAGFQASTSMPQLVTVTGLYPSTTTLSSTGSPGNYTLTATVLGIGSATFAPTGSVSFVDTTNGNAVLGSATPGAGTFGYSQIQPTQPIIGSPLGVATGDFNGDGIVDLITTDGMLNKITVMLGNGDGTFQTGVDYAAGSFPNAVKVADFNGDGILDIVAVNESGQNVSVFIGNGDGTFKPQATYSVATSPSGVGVMDLNHDGIPDIVVSNLQTATISVLIGKGDGTFQSAVTINIPLASGYNPTSLTEDDFNGDGNVDLAVTYENNNVGIYLGKGDGTFQTPVNYATGSSPVVVSVGDFNGDGNADLATANEGDGTVSILLGNGDGTFQPKVPYTVGNGPIGMTIADFNGDGNQDIAIGNAQDLTGAFLIGKGDGTFQLATQLMFSVPGGTAPYGLAAADFNGDGFPDLAVATYASSNGGEEFVRLSQITQTATATITGVALSGSAGSHNVDAVYAGDANFKTSTSLGINLTKLGSQTITFPSISNQTYGNAPFTLNATASSGLTVSYTVTSGPATVSGSTVTITGVGNVIIQATQAGNSSYTAATPVSQSFTVAQASQTITFPSIPNHLVTDAPFALNATASSGLAVSYAVLSGPATVSGNVVTVTGSGTVVIQAMQTGNTNYTAAGPVSQPFVVSLVSQTITFPGIPSHTYGDSPFTLNATSSSGLAVSYTVTSGPATVSGNTVTLSGAGSVTIQATQAGNTTYAAATPVSQSFTVSTASQTITFPGIPSHTYGDAPFALGATASSNLAVTYAVLSGPATVSGNTVTLTGAGSVTIQASQAGNATYAAATPVSQSFTVAQSSQTITFPAIPNHTVTDAPFTLSATASSGLAVSYAVVSGPATIAGNTVTLTGVGTVVIRASQAGNTNYAAATAVSQSFTVSLATQTISFSTIPNQVYGGAPFTINATASSGLAVSFAVVSGPATVSGNTVTITGAGAVTIQATQAGNTTYAAATPVSQSFTVSTASQTITFPGIANHAATDAPFAISATSSSGLAVTFTVTSGPATISGNTVTLTGAGAVVIQASQAGNANYAAAAPVSQSFTVSLATQTITFPAIPGHVFGDAPFTLNATASSNLAVTYSVTSGPATVLGNTVTLTGAGTVVIQASQAGNASYAAATSVSQSFVVLPAAPALVSITPAGGVLNSAATTITLTGSNFVSSDVVQLNGAALVSTFVNATTLTAVVPASFFTSAGTGQVTVADTNGRTTSTQTFTVLAAPAINFSGPATTTSAAQPTLTFQLVNPYPLAISGTLTLTFTPASNGVDDPAVQFSTGGRTLTFTIPALSTVTPTVQIQTGTVVGTATVSLVVTSSGANVTPANVTPVQITIAAAVPTITSSAITRSGNTLSVSVDGFSNTRELSMAIFHFTAVPGTTISTPDITAPVTTVFGNYFTSSASTGYGSTFLYTQTFNLNDNDANSIQSVTVTLVNSQGQSMTSTAQ